MTTRPVPQYPIVYGPPSAILRQDTSVPPVIQQPIGLPCDSARGIQSFGQEPDDSTIATLGILSLLGTGLGAYHGYARNRSVGWALWWAFLGGLAPVITVPVAIAQGFGKPKTAYQANRRAGVRRRLRSKRSRG